MKPLLSITTEKIRLELRGPRSEPIALGKRAAHMRVETHGDELESVSWFDTDETEHSAASGNGPTLYEWTAYELFAESRNGDAIELHHRDPRLFASVASPQHHFELLSGRLSFRGQVGLTRLEVRVAGRPALDLEVEVFPTKLDYESDYLDLVSEVNSATRALALEYLRATYQGATEEHTPRPRDLEFATLLRHHATELDRAMQWVTMHPTRQLLRSPESQRVEQIRRPSHITTKAIRQRRGEGAFVNAPGLGPIRRKLPSVRAVETLDTPEHRWLRAKVARVKQRVHLLLEAIKLEMRRAEAQGRATGRLLAESEELSAFDARLGRILSVAPLSEAVGRAPQGFSSLRLLQAPGYREAVRALLALSRGLTLGGGAIETSVKDVEVLYEYWCFLRLAALLVEVSRGEADLSGLFRETGTGLRTRLESGSNVEVSINGSWSLRLGYNRSFAGLTGTQRPDLVLTLQTAGWPPAMVIFDAKYRVQADPEYLRKFGLPGPPADAINQLHRYRDAIVTKSDTGDRSRPVVRAVALFPLDAATSKGWGDGSLYSALTDYGIGALPFLPHNEQLVKSWLMKVLSEPMSRLAVSGPPFAAATELRRIEQLAVQAALVVDADEATIARCIDERTVEVQGFVPVAKVDVVALLETTPTADIVVRVVADVKAIDLSGASAVLVVEPRETVARSLEGSNGALPTGVTSVLALDRASSAQELGLGAVAEWDLIELLRRRGLRYDASIVVDSSQRLHTTISLGDSSVKWTQGVGFVVLSHGRARGATREVSQVIADLTEV